VLEDVDAAFVQRQGADTPRSSVTFSGLLNCLDGVLSGEDRVIFMTTNHLDRLDPAIIRPGRVDLVSYLDDADEAQVERFFASFYPIAAEADAAAHAKLAVVFARRVSELGVKVSMAHLQGFLLAFKDDPEAATTDEAMARLRQQIDEAQGSNDGGAGAGEDAKSVLANLLEERNGGGKRKTSRGRRITGDEVDRMAFNPQPGWEEMVGMPPDKTS
jgi:chaperone BCS1